MVKEIRKSQIYTPEWKLAEVKDDVAAGRTSRSEGPPQVQHVERGRYLMVDGHHRTVEHRGRRIEVEVVKNVATYGMAVEMMQTNEW